MRRQREGKAKAQGKARQGKQATKAGQASLQKKTRNALRMLLCCFAIKISVG
jgi:hypothetical protein